MKGRESGMPDAAYWATFFDADAVVRLLGIAPGDDIVEFGSGYGTFTLPAARRTRGLVHALDIEPDLVAALREDAARHGLPNIREQQRDFIAAGTGMADASVDHAMLYNILHVEDPVALLREARRVLKPGGVASVIHWRSDIDTPRGPSLDIRPRAEHCLAWARAAGFVHGELRDISTAAPFHFGLLLR